MAGAKTERDAVAAIKAVITPSNPANADEAEGRSAPAGSSPPVAAEEPDVPRDEQPEAQEGGERVPLKRFNAAVSNLKKETAKREQLERELGSLREKLADVEDGKIVDTLSEKTPKGYEEWPLDRQNAWIAKTVANDVSEKRLGDLLPYLKTAATQIRVSKELGVTLSPDQAEAIASVMEDAPKLTPQEAMVIASQRNEELFTQGENVGKKKALPASHSVTDPQRGPKSEVRTRDDRGRFLDQVKAGKPGTLKKAAVDYIQDVLFGKPKKK